MSSVRIGAVSHQDGQLPSLFALVALEGDVRHSGRRRLQIYRGTTANCLRTGQIEKLLENIGQCIRQLRESRSMTQSQPCKHAHAFRDRICRGSRADR